METIVQPYNLFAQQKMAGYPTAEQIQQEQQKSTPGQFQGATVNDFAAGKRAANSQAEGYGANPITPMEPAKKVEPVKQVKPVEQIKPVERVTQQPITSMDDLAKAMGYTSPEEEDRLRKASVANQRIMAVADALRHIGNIAHTINYAPSQQFNNPVQEERQRYLQGKALRDKANLTYMNYMQAKAAQDQKMRQWEQQYNLQVANAASQDAYRQAQAKVAAERAANQKGYYEGQLSLGRSRLEETTRNNKERLEETKRANKVREGQGAARVKIARDNYELRKSRGAGSGNGNIAPLDTPKGQITPNGRSYSNQLLQMFDYARSQGLVQESDVAKRLRELGYGKDQSDNVKRQMVMDLLRQNPTMGDYAASRLGWTYGDNSNAPSIGWDDDDDDIEENDDLVIGW